MLIRRAERVAPVDDALQRGPHPGIGEEEVDEAGPGDFDLLNVVVLGEALDDGFGDLAGSHARGPRQTKRDRARQIPVRALLGRVHGDLRDLVQRKRAVSDGLFQSLMHRCGDDVPRCAPHAVLSMGWVE